MIENIGFRAPWIVGEPHMTDLRVRLAVFRTGRTPLGGESISIRTGRPVSDIGFSLLVESRFDTPVKGTPVVKTGNAGFTEHDLMDPRVTAKLEELGMSGGGFSTSLSKNGAIIINDPDGDMCCILRKKDDGKIESSAWLTPYTVRNRNEKLASTAGLSSSF